MSWLRRWWALTEPSALPEPSDHPGTGQPRTARDWTVDAAAFVIAVALGTLILRVTIHDTANQMTTGHVAMDVAFGTLSCVSLWWRRRWPFGVALACVLLGALSTLGTVAGLLALSSLAVHRH